MLFWNDDVKKEDVKMKINQCDLILDEEKYANIVERETLHLLFLSNNAILSTLNKLQKEWYNRFKSLETESFYELDHTKIKERYHPKDYSFFYEAILSIPKVEESDFLNWLSDFSKQNEFLYQII